MYNEGYISDRGPAPKPRRARARSIPSTCSSEWTCSNRRLGAEQETSPQPSRAGLHDRAKPMSGVTAIGRRSAYTNRHATCGAQRPRAAETSEGIVVSMATLIDL